MSNPPDISDAVVAVAAMAAWIRAQLDRPPGPCESPADLAHSAAGMAWLADEALWCRDGLLAVARHHRPALHWSALEDATSTSDATLIGRWQRWQHREATR